MTIEAVDCELSIPEEYIEIPGIEISIISEKTPTMQFDFLVQAFSRAILTDFRKAQQMGITIEKYGIFIHQVPIPHHWDSIRFAKVLKYNRPVQETENVEPD